MADFKINEIQNEKQLLEYLKSKARNHINYRQYLTKGKLESIKKHKCIYLADGETWNDVIDKNNFNNIGDAYKHFGSCFTYSKSENVALWMLYANNKNTKELGFMINLSKSAIEKILEIDTIEIGYFDEKNEFVSKRSLKKSDFKIDIIDMLYYGAGSDDMHYYVKRSDDVNKNLSKEIVDKLGYCKKKKPWSYENETRLVITIEKTKIDDGMKICKINLDQIKPTSKGELVYDIIMSNIYQSPCCNDKKEGYKASKLTGEINWDI